MVLKRQTVWLLTMLSLIIVLSVYYINSPVPTDQLAFLDDEKDSDNGKKDGNEENSGEDDPFIELENVTGLEDVDNEFLSKFSSDEQFNAIRLQRQEARDRLSGDYVAVMASENTTAEVQSQALDNIENLRVLAQKEERLETLIKTKGYDDVLVIAEENEVKIIVKADELSPEEGISIMQMAKEQLNINDVAVAFQPKK